MKFIVIVSLIVIYIFSIRSYFKMNKSKQLPSKKPLAVHLKPFDSCWLAVKMLVNKLYNYLVCSCSDK